LSGIPGELVVWAPVHQHELEPEKQGIERPGARQSWTGRNLWGRTGWGVRGRRTAAWGGEARLEGSSGMVQERAKFMVQERA